MSYTSTLNISEQLDAVVNVVKQTVGSKLSQVQSTTAGQTIPAVIKKRITDKASTNQPAVNLPYPYCTVDFIRADLWGGCEQLNFKVLPNGNHIYETDYIVKIAVDFVGSGAPGTVGSSGPSTFTYVQKGAPYTTRKGSFVTNLVIGSPVPTTITETAGTTAYVTVPVTWTVLPGSELASAGPKSREISLKGVMNGDQTITLKGNNAVFVVGGTNPEDVLTMLIHGSELLEYVE